MSQSRTKMTWAGQMGQSRTGQDKSPKAGRPAQGWTSGSSGRGDLRIIKKGQLYEIMKFYTRTDRQMESKTFLNIFL